jgi:hypothetical protein
MTHSDMVERFPDGFQGAVEAVESQSDRALYEYLHIHLCGPYINDCHAYLSTVKQHLRDEGFTNTKLCTDWVEDPPEHLDKPSEERSQTEEQKLREFWTDVSKEFLDNADVAVFFFLDPTPARSELSSDTVDDVDHSVHHRHDEYELSQDPNGSVLVELRHWLDTVGVDPDRTFVIFEETNYEETGSLVSGEVGNRDVHWEKVPTDNVEVSCELTVSRCQNWAMGPCKRRVRDRYYDDHF